MATKRQQTAQFLPELAGLVSEHLQSGLYVTTEQPSSLASGLHATWKVHLYDRTGYVKTLHIGTPETCTAFLHGMRATLGIIGRDPAASYDEVTG